MTNTVTVPDTTAIARRNQPSRLATILLPIMVCLAGYLIYELVTRGLETLRALDALIVYS